MRDIAVSLVEKIRGTRKVYVKRDLRARETKKISIDRD